MNQAASDKRIGLFDSGVGGLSILRFLQEKALDVQKDIRFVYVADTGRCPYGNRSAAEISLYVEQIVSWLNGAGVDRIIMACNTSAAVAVHTARRISHVPVHDLISPVADFVANKYKNIGVVATSTTCKSKAFSRAIHKFRSGCNVLEIPCPDLVPLVEQGLFDGPTVAETIEKYVHQLKSAEVDCVIFGCTHFPFLEGAFKKQMPQNVDFIDPALHLGLEVLGENTVQQKASLTESNFQKNTYFCTGDPEKFAASAELCLGLGRGSLHNSVCALNTEELQLSVNSEMDANTMVLNNPFYAPSTPAP